MEKVLLIVAIVSLVFSLLFFPLEIYEHFAGPKEMEKLLKKMHFPFGYKGFIIFVFVTFFVMVAAFFIRMKILGEI